MEKTDALLAAWREAAKDLDIAVEELANRIHVVDFGSNAGMLCELAQTREDQLALRKDAEAMGAGYSGIGEWYLQYDRASYIEMLNDWGWTGEGDPPDWYTGEQGEQGEQVE